MKKICIVSQSFSGGGAEKIAVNLANQYQKDGLDVVFIVLDLVGPYRYQLNEEIRLIDIGQVRFSKMCFPFFSLIRKEKPDYILSVMRVLNVKVGVALFFLPKVNLFFREASTFDNEKDFLPLSRFVRRVLQKLAYSKARCVISNSYDTQADLVKYKICSKEKTVVIGNPVVTKDVMELARPPVSHPWFVNKEIVVVLSVGRLHSQKNQKLLVKAFSFIHKRILNSRLVILGDGEEREELLRTATELGVRDVFEIVPFVQNPFPYYAQADLFALSSSSEGFGNVLVEALACGTNVVSTDCSGGPKFILDEGRYGILVPNNDAGALAKAMAESLIGSAVFDPAVLKLRAQEFTVEKISKRYWAVFEVFSK